MVFRTFALMKKKVCRMRTKLITKILDFKVNKTA